MGSSKRIYAAMEFPFEFGRSLPVTSLFPLYLMAFGAVSDASKVAMVFTGTVFIVILHAAYGVSNASPARTRMARMFGANRWQIFWRITIWEALPDTLGGMRSALSIALIVVVVSEMFIGTVAGAGQRIFQAYQRNSLETLYAIIVFMGVAGYVSNKLFIMIEKRIAFWAGK